MQSQRRIKFTRRALLGAAGAALTQAAFATQDSFSGITLTASDVHPDHYPTVEAVRWMSDRIERETNGRMRIRVYHSGQLGREGDTVDLVRFGAIDMARVNFAALNNAFPLTRVFSLPYVFDSVDHMRSAVDGKPGTRVLKGFETRDLIGLAMYDSGARCFYNTHRAIHEPQDLHGLKIRVPPSDMFIAMVKQMGANATILSFGEIFSALQTRLIDGAENNWRGFHSSRQFEVARYWTQTEHSFSPEALLLSKRRFQQLSPSDRELFLAVARESVPYMRGLWDKAEAESRAAVIKAGVTVGQVDRELFKRATAPVVAQFLKNPSLQALYDEIHTGG
jgi:tripartite ATP-independent transporter DctP family solute receptor